MIDGAPTGTQRPSRGDAPCDGIRIDPGNDRELGCQVHHTRWLSIYLLGMIAFALNSFGLLLLLLVGVGLTIVYSRRTLRSETPARGDDVRRIARRQKDMAALSRSLHAGRRHL